MLMLCYHYVEKFFGMFMNDIPTLYQFVYSCLKDGQTNLQTLLVCTYKYYEKLNVTNKLHENKLHYK